MRLSAQPTDIFTPEEWYVRKLAILRGVLSMATEWRDTAREYADPTIDPTCPWSAEKIADKVRGARFMMRKRALEWRAKLKALPPAPDSVRQGQLSLGGAQ